MRPVFVKKVKGNVYGLDIVMFSSEPLVGAPETFHTLDPLKKLDPGEASYYYKRLDSF